MSNSGYAKTPVPRIYNRQMYAISPQKNKRNFNTGCSCQTNIPKQNVYKPIWANLVRKDNLYHIYSKNQ